MQGAAVVSFTLLAIVGCAAPGSQFQIVNYREGAGAERFEETFPEAWYDVDASGNIDIVLRRETPGAVDRSDTVLQLVHMRTFWRCIPGITVAHRTQINGTVTYGILNGSLGATFEGSGSVFVDLGEKGAPLTGTLELARLRPVRQLVEGTAIFNKVELTGRFEAAFDPGKTVALMNELERTFGNATAAK
jgi:hypothetical protein